MPVYPSVPTTDSQSHGRQLELTTNMKSKAYEHQHPTFSQAHFPQRVDRIPEGLYLRAAIKPLYYLIRDQGHESVDRKFVRQECDHERIIGTMMLNRCSGIHIMS
jgi:hypothetical protein